MEQETTCEQPKITLNVDSLDQKMSPDRRIDVDQEFFAVPAIQEPEVDVLKKSSNPNIKVEK